MYTVELNGRVEVKAQLFLTSVLDEVSGQLHAWAAIAPEYLVPFLCYLYRAL